MSNNLFCYGTLMNKQILFTVMKKNPESASQIQFIPAKLPLFKRTQVVGVKYPAAHYTGKKDDFIEGVVVTGLSAKDMKFLDWFEGSEYQRVSADVIIDDSAIEVQVYRWSDPIEKLVDQDWDASWLNNEVTVTHWLEYEIESLKDCPTFD